MRPLICSTIIAIQAWNVSSSVHYAVMAFIPSLFIFTYLEGISNKLKR